jgi:hypothetical protein
MATEVHDRQVRAGRNQALFREVNERIESLRQGIYPQTEIDFVCECYMETCFEPVPSVTIAEYEAVRARADRFVVHPGHIDTAAEVVVDELDRYWVVEKIGVAREVAVASDRRPADRQSS